VIVLLDHEAITPDGKSTGTPIPVAPIVVCVIEVSGVLIHNVGLELGTPAVLSGVTIILPVAFTIPHPPDNGIL
jgi:hypothetical protein